ncbi:helix-turn-helix domain-containing protein [Niveibacterium sp.]|uniref:helix-turn-helix domain-containing protein n=1 Tax=Niveibacterium sp. TaxID=2017444 RepID=UPI0035AE5BD0
MAALIIEGFRTMSVAEAAEQLGISPQAVRRLLRSGLLHGFRLNQREWRVMKPLTRVEGRRGPKPEKR